jgi:hypothetical protein
MYIGLAASCVAMVGAWFLAKKFALEMKEKISFVFLTGGLSSLVTAGFMFSSLVGVCSIAASCIVVAFLFGYEGSN